MTFEPNRFQIQIFRAMLTYRREIVKLIGKFQPLNPVERLLLKEIGFRVHLQQLLNGQNKRLYEAARDRDYMYNQWGGKPLWMD